MKIDSMNFISLLTFLIFWGTMESIFNGFGSHGTTAYHAISIREHGFDPTKTKLGRMGKGCYFWAYHKSPEIADKLAYEWWKYSKYKSENKEGDYPYDLNKDCRFCLFRVSLFTNQKNYFDADTPEFMEAYMRVKKSNKFNDRKIAEYIISLFQKRLGEYWEDKDFKLNIIKISLSLPARSAFNTPFGKGYYAYIVLNKDAIKIVDDLIEPNISN